MRGMRETREIQRNNYQDGQCEQSFCGRTSSVSLIAHTHTHTHTDAENRRVRSGLSFELCPVHAPHALKLLSEK